VPAILLMVGLAGALAVATGRYYLVALALPLALLDNRLRIAVIGLLAEYGGVAFAHGWHDWVGRGMHVLAAAPVVMLGRFARQLDKRRSRDRARHSPTSIRVSPSLVRTSSRRRREHCRFHALG
jgi:exosortase/archaeosortase family protein